MRLENSFTVPTSSERAWELLTDVPRVIPCMPGAELVEVVDENTFKVMLHVRLGPVALQFATDVRREELEGAQHLVRLGVNAREVKGRGGARATIESSLSDVDGETRVSIVTDLTLQGAVAQYGRGVVGAVAAQLTERFAQSLAGQLEQELPAIEDQDTPASEVQPAASTVKPVGGVRLALVALWRSLFRRRST